MTSTASTDDYVPVRSTMVSFEASCCGCSDFDVITRGVYADRQVLEAKSLLRCSHCHQTWLLTGQARREVEELAYVTPAR